MRIEVVLTEAEIEQELAEGLEARDIPEKLFYWSPLSVRAWLSRTTEAPFASLRQCWVQLASRAAWLLQPFLGAVPVISFGAGDGATDRALLERVRDSGREQKYYPVDAGQALLEMACAGAEDMDIEVTGIKADISSPMHLVFASDAAESPKLLLMSGNTLGGFDPLAQIRHVAECVRPGDRLVIDAEIHQTNGGALHEGEAARQFAFAPLAALGVAAEEGEVRFEQKRDESLAGLHLTAAYFRPVRDLHTAMPDHEVLIERGEHINLNFRYSFTPEALRLLIGKHGGLRILEEIPSADRRYVLAVCSR